MPKLKKKRKKIQKPSHHNSQTFRLVVLVVVIILSVLIWFHQPALHKFRGLGYLGIFIINFVSSATVLVPFPGIATVFFGGAVLSPILLGLVSGMGATLGELLGYFTGYGGRGILTKIKRANLWLYTVEKVFNKAGFITIFAFALLPIPLFDFVGILAGAVDYPVWKFALATFLGRTIRNTVIAWSGDKLLPL